MQGIVPVPNPNYSRQDLFQDMGTPPAETRHLDSLRRSFSAAASSYLQSAGVQERVAASLLKATSITPGRILEVGCGSGMLTFMVARQFPGLRFDALDISPRMIEEARRLAGTDLHRENMRGVHWIVSDVAHHRPPASYDLILSSSSLHWLHPLDSGMLHLAELLAPGGRLVCAVMVDGTMHELRASRMVAAPDKPPLGRLPSTSEFVSAVESAGFQVLTRRETEFTSTYGSAAEFLRRLRRLGVTGGLVSQAHAPLTPGELRRLAKHYDAHYAVASGGVTATYRVLFLEAATPQS